jgi:hypothetical protein
LSAIASIETPVAPSLQDDQLVFAYIGVGSLLGSVGDLALIATPLAASLGFGYCDSQDSGGGGDSGGGSGGGGETDMIRGATRLTEADREFITRLVRGGEDA